jgi:hypothetical protein
MSGMAILQQRSGVECSTIQYSEDEMPLFRRIHVLICLLAMIGIAGAQSVPPQPAASLELASLLAPGENSVISATLSFLTDRSLVVGGCNHEQHCRLVILDLASGKPHATATTEVIPHYFSLYRSSNGGVLLDWENYPGTTLYAPDLHEARTLPDIKLEHWTISSTAKTFGDALPDRWTVHGPPPSWERLHEGRGELLSVSDEAVVYQDDRIVRTETMEGKLLGSFKVESSSKCPTLARLLARDRLWVESCFGHQGIRDFNGRHILALPTPDGWGYRLGQSSDGTRLLYDRYTRHVSILQRTGEYAIALASIGFGAVDEKANGEFVRVIDTVNGRTCFEWRSSAGIAEEGQYHADLAPSGQMVVILTQTTLSIYQLPQECKAK